ncbi:MAG: NAD(P)H-hydrate dehydratase [Ignavibacteria bacterium]|nr:NAD(P)H-hydrate dehydratase [Ignavibacteria bacterium]
MRSVFFNQEVLDAERKIISSLSIPSIVLMENAGKNSAEYIYKTVCSENFNNVIILAGKGNNAGDGFVITRHLLSKGVPVKVLLLYPASDLKGDAKTNYDVLKKMTTQGELSIKECRDVKGVKKELSVDNPLIIDAIFGIGFKGELEARLKKVFSFVNSIGNKKVIAIDTASGLDSHETKEDCIRADVTLSMGVKKFNSMFSNGREFSGAVEIMDIGISDKEFDGYNIKNMYEIEVSDVKGFLPPRNINSNKYTNGKLFILAGSPGFTGAAYLSSLSALRAGSGAVILGIPESLNEIMEIKTTEVITLSLADNEFKSFSKDSYDIIREKLEWCDVCLIGPGISRNEETLELVRMVVSQNNNNFVIDADGIFAFKGHLDLLKKKKRNIILTPHYGEFSNLTGLNLSEIKQNFHTIAREFAAEYNVILGLKNSPTIITDGEYFYINSTGRENLATIGSGDVLSGIIASAYSQTLDAMNSTVYGMYIHGRCGDILFDETGDSTTIASDLIDEIPIVKEEL